MDHRIKDVVGLVTQYVDQLLQFVQGFDVPTLAALLLIPVLIAALARKVVLALASALLSIVSLMLIINPASATSVLGVAGGIGSFLIALGSICGRRRSNALRNLQKELKHLTERVERTEAAENRRMLLELKTRTNIATIPDNHGMK
jgi:K+-sensing histidine kinase KdpD